MGVIYSKQKIFNLTLKNLQVTVPVSEANKNDKNYAVLEEYYQPALNQVLESTDWAFANAYRTLLLLSGQKPLNPNYRFAYDYPNDVAVPREIVIKAGENKERFEVATVERKLQLWCNRENAVLRYTKLDINENEFCSSFTISLSWYLAFLACPAISGARAKQSDCLQIYTRQLENAQVVNANIDFPVADTPCSWLDVR